MIMTEICYLNLKQAREVLVGIGVELTPRQIKWAADKDARGMRKLPFFVDPIEGTLKIEKKECSSGSIEICRMTRRTVQNINPYSD